MKNHKFWQENEKNLFKIKLICEYQKNRYKEQKRQPQRGFYLQCSKLIGSKSRKQCNKRYYSQTKGKKIDLETYLKQIFAPRVDKFYQYFQSQLRSLKISLQQKIFDHRQFEVITDSITTYFDNRLAEFDAELMKEQLDYEDQHFHIRNQKIDYEGLFVNNDESL